MAKYKHVDKLKEPSSPAMENGNVVHKLAEEYAIGTRKVLPKELENFTEEFAALRKISKKLSVEQQVAFDSNWKLTDWFAKDVWLRVKLDLYYQDTPGNFIIIDHKTGRVRKENDIQLDLYGAVMFAQHPNAKTVKASFWYLDAGEISDVKVYTPAAAEKQKRIWEKRSLPMLTDTKFKPTPGHHCTYCYFSSRKVSKDYPKGGPCKWG